MIHLLHRGALPLAVLWALALPERCAGAHEGNNAKSDTAAAASRQVLDGLRYRLVLTADDPPEIRIQLSVKMPDASSSEFAVQPHWGGVERVDELVYDLVARNAAGEALKVERRSDAPNRWSVAHAPRAEVTLSYGLRPVRDPRETSGNQYRPIVNAALFHFIGEAGLIVPGWADEERATTIGLEWSGFDRPGWSVVSSFGAGAAPRQVQRSLADFRHGLFLAGRLNIGERTIGANKLAVAIHGDAWQIDTDAFCDLIERIVRAERDFFDDHSVPFYLVSMIPNRDEGPGSFSFGGTGLTDCFALFCSPQLDLSRRGPHRVRLLHVLAHEYFHNWNGVKIKRESPEELAYWFSEGFTDFYASRLLYKAGLITARQWVARTNEDLRDYWTSPVRDAGAERIGAEFWRSRELQDLPYKRGSAVALALDWEIRRRSQGQRGLDDFMRDLFRRTQADGAKLSNRALLALIAEWTAPEFAEHVAAVVERGEMLKLHGDLFSPHLLVELATVTPPARGLEAAAGAQERTVAGVPQLRMASPPKF